LVQKRKDQWLPPPSGTLKFNVDGAVAKSQNTGAFSVVCRNEHGGFVGCSSVRVVGITDPTVLEAMACVEALCLATDLQATKLLIVSDCLTVVKEIQNKASGGPDCMLIK
jgi:ribonuclease HI